MKKVQKALGHTHFNTTAKYVKFGDEEVLTAIGAALSGLK